MLWCYFVFNPDYYVTLLQIKLKLTLNVLGFFFLFFNFNRKKEQKFVNMKIGSFMLLMENFLKITLIFVYFTLKKNTSNKKKIDSMNNSNIREKY